MQNKAAHISDLTCNQWNIPLYASNLRISQIIGKKYVFLWKKLNFELIGNSVHTK